MAYKLRLFFYFFCAFCLVQCKENKTASTKLITKKKITNSVKDSIRDDDTLYIDESVIVIGKKSKPADRAVRYVGVKFKPHIRFGDFPVKVTSAKKAPLQYNSNPLGTQFKTRITQTYHDDQVNFGGHYVFIKWGCGSPCYMSALVDINSGIIYDGISSGYGYDFKKDSRMLIANPTGLDGFYLNCASCEPLIYVWDEGNKKFTER